MATRTLKVEVPCVLLLATLTSTLAYNPFGTTAAPPPGPPPGNQACMVTPFTSLEFMSPFSNKAFVDGSNTVCKAYHCDGNTGTASQELAISRTCSTGCVDVAASLTYCACKDNCPSSGGTPPPPPAPSPSPAPAPSGPAPPPPPPPDGPSGVCGTSSPCQNGATCVNTGADSYSCTCPPLFTGTNCEVNLCDGYCENGATCSYDSSKSTGKSCACAPGYRDERCQTHECDSQPPPCYYGSCVKDSTHPDGFTCTCVNGYAGDRCDMLPTCEDTWHKLGTSCYKGFDIRMTYSQARGRCGQEGGELSPAKTQQENDFIRGRLDGLGSMWVGLSDAVTEGTFVWEDGASLGSFNNWKSGEPDDTQGTKSDADCVGLSNSGKWLDYRCNTNRIFVCKKPATLQSATP